MILASIEGTIFAAVIAVVMVVVRLLSERAAKNQQPPQQRANPSPGDAAKRDSEEERMRRFMEALGIPADAAPSAPTPPPVRQPPVKREPTIRPVPPIVVAETPRWPRKEAVPPPMPRRAGMPVPPKRSLVSEPVAGPVPQPNVPVRTELPELEATAVERFRAASGDISTMATEAWGEKNLDVTGVTAVREVGEARVHDKSKELWQDALRSPGALRSAFILKEILGTPRGLQSAQVAHSFPSL